MFILWFTQVKGELIVYGKIVVTTLIHGVAKIMVLCVTLFTMVPSDPLGGAKTIATPMITQCALSITITLTTIAPIDGVTKISVTAPLTMFALGVVLTRLLAHTRTRHVTHAVTVALTRGTRGKMPLLSVSCTRVTGLPGPGAGP